MQPGSPLLRFTMYKQYQVLVVYYSCNCHHPESVSKPSPLKQYKTPTRCHSVPKYKDIFNSILIYKRSLYFGREWCCVLVRSRNAGSGWISCLGKGKFYTTFGITAPEFLVFPVTVSPAFCALIFFAYLVYQYGSRCPVLTTRYAVRIENAAHVPGLIFLFGKG